jgi:hypothetical protein
MLEQDEYFAAVELGLEQLNPFISCSISEETDDDGEPTGKVFAILTVQEDLEFHRNLDREKGNPHNQLFTLEGRPTEAVISVLRKLVEDRYKGENFELDDTGTEYFEFDIVLTVDPDQEAGDLGGKFWEETELVRFHNEADPGTFGSPYLFGSLIYEGLQKLDS